MFNYFLTLTVIKVPVYCVLVFFLFIFINFIIIQLLYLDIQISHINIILNEKFKERNIQRKKTS